MVCTGNASLGPAFPCGGLIGLETSGRLVIPGGSVQDFPGLGVRSMGVALGYRLIQDRPERVCPFCAGEIFEQFIVDFDSAHS